MQPADAREQIGCALDERGQGAHRDGHTTLGEIAPDAIRRRE